MIRNASRKKTLIGSSEIMNSYFQKSTGLMFHSKVDKGLIFPFKKARRIGIHMLFVFTPIDILFLNEENKIVEITEGLKPFCFYMSKNRARTFVELPSGTVNKTKTRIGDKIEY
ncbi:MAG: DUF192 domain-containing protein [Nanoarchaeota archaeon]